MITWALPFTLLATTYGYGEKMCGEVIDPKPCVAGQLTASGIPFDPLIPTVAVHSTPNRRIRGTAFVCLRHLVSGAKVFLRVTDKHYMDGRIDLSPAAVAAIGGNPTNYWSSRVESCNRRSTKHDYVSNGTYSDFRSFFELQISNLLRPYP